MKRKRKKTKRPIRSIASASAEPVQMDPAFDDAGLDFPKGLVDDPTVSNQIRALYTEPRNTGELQAKVAATESTFREYFGHLDRQHKNADAKRIVDGLFDYLQRLGRSTARRTVLTYYLIGFILDRVEESCATKAEYMSWLRNTFGREKHLESLRQARKLVDLGRYAIRYSFLGKNKCLELVYLYRQHIQEENDRRIQRGEPVMTEADRQTLLEELDQEFAGPGFAQDDELDSQDNDPIRVRLDTAITISRLKAAGIDQAVFTREQAKLLALYRGLALELRMAKEIKEALDSEATVEGKVAKFDSWVKNRMHLPEESTPMRPVRVRTILAAMAEWMDKKRRYIEHDVATLKGNRDDSIRSLTDAYRVVLYLADRLDILDQLELPETAVDAIKARIEPDSPPTNGGEP